MVSDSKQQETGFAGACSCEEGTVKEDAALEGERSHQSLSLRYSAIAKAWPALLSSSPPALTNRFISALLRAPHIAAASPRDQSGGRSILSAAAGLLPPQLPVCTRVSTDASRATIAPAQRRTAPHAMGKPGRAQAAPGGPGSTRGRPPGLQALPDRLSGGGSRPGRWRQHHRAAAAPPQRRLLASRGEGQGGGSGSVSLPAPRPGTSPAAATCRPRRQHDSGRRRPQVTPRGPFRCRRRRLLYGPPALQGGQQPEPGQRRPPPPLPREEGAAAQPELLPARALHALLHRARR